MQYTRLQHASPAVVTGQSSDGDDASVAIEAAEIDPDHFN